MKFCCFVACLAGLLVSPHFVSGQTSDLVTPIIKTVSPVTAVIGQIVSADGNALKSRVSDVYLTDGKKDYKVTLLEQSEQTLKFKVPAGVPVGHYRLMVATPDNPPFFVEQPAVLDVINMVTGG
jgi:hypothetical protein